MRTVCVLRGKNGRVLPKGVLGVLGNFVGVSQVEGESVDVFDFVPDDYPGAWTVTEFDVKLVGREP